MVWYIITTWGEDLGAAKRVSLIAIRSNDPAHSDPSARHYFAQCRIKTPYGSVETVQTDPVQTRLGPYNTIPFCIEFDLKRNLRRRIREKYPK